MRSSPGVDWTPYSPSTQLVRSRTCGGCALISVDVENNLLLVEGAVPGPAGGYVFVRESKTKK